ncbi:MAG: hypothetical protein CME59_04505 [Halioglobus sp.]|nr:hypothetical protein [Halioglobus sp.]
MVSCRRVWVVSTGHYIFKQQEVHIVFVSSDMQTSLNILNVICMVCGDILLQDHIQVLFRPTGKPIA